jgi:hypothetical protein
MGTVELHSEIDRLAAADLSGDAAVLGIEVLEIRRAIHRLQAQESRRLTPFDAAEGFLDAGQTSSKGWLREQTTMSHAEAAARQAVARIAGRLPVLVAAWRAGETTFDHLRVVETQLRKLPVELWAEVDAEITKRARTETVAEFAAWLRYLAESLDGEPKSKDETQRQARRLSLSVGFQGMTNLVGRFTPEVAEKLKSMLSAASRPDAPDEVRTVGQRNADAVEYGLDCLLASGRLPSEAAEKPQLRISVDLDQISEAAQRDEETLRQQQAWAALTDEEKAARIGTALGAAAAAADPGSGHPRYYWTGTASVSAVRRLACDGEVLPIFTRNGVPIDVGRRYRMISNSMRALIEGRDRHCQWPGCDVPGRWCQVHHVQHWKDGGTTDRWNLILLCDHHHHAAHDGRFTIILHKPGNITIRHRTRPDQPYYEIRLKAPPPTAISARAKLQAVAADLARAGGYG